jgi:hypothetical protein
MEFWNTVFEEMAKGNFSFAILIVGVVQLVVMIISLISIRKRNER